MMLSLLPFVTLLWCACNRFQACVFLLSLLWSLPSMASCHMFFPSCTPVSFFFFFFSLLCLLCILRVVAHRISTNSLNREKYKHILPTHYTRTLTLSYCLHVHDINTAAHRNALMYMFLCDFFLDWMNRDGCIRSTESILGQITWVDKHHIVSDPLCK
jgi:hypothetical protein